MYRGVGKWILVLMRGYFESGSGSSEPEDVTGKGTCNSGVLFYLLVHLDCSIFFLFDYSLMLV